MNFRNGRAIVAAGMASLLAVALAACAGGGGNGSGSAGAAVRGGTLQLLGASDVDHLDTASAYYTASYTLERAFTRQLFTYPASTDLHRAIAPVADAATEVPTKANGGISADGTTYTIHIRPGVKWNTTPARVAGAADGAEVLAADRVDGAGRPAAVGQPT